MKYNDQANLDPSQMGGGGSGGGGGRIALGGGAGLVVVVLALLFGINPGDILGSQSADPAPSGGSSPFAQCTKGSDINTDRDCRFVAFTNSIQDYWGDTVQNYQVIKVQTFTGSINTACGNATSAVGPFYCPGDTQVYLDLGFFDQLKSDLGAEGGDAAEAYVLAHEFGHHIQNLTGTMAKVQGGGQGTGPKSPQVRLELQADCYAGVWFKHATERPQLPDHRGQPGRPGPRDSTRPQRWATTGSSRRARARSRRSRGPTAPPPCGRSGSVRASAPATPSSATPLPPGPWADRLRAGSAPVLAQLPR